MHTDTRARTHSDSNTTPPVLPASENQTQLTSLFLSLSLCLSLANLPHHQSYDLKFQSPHPRHAFPFSPPSTFPLWFHFSTSEVTPGESKGRGERGEAGEEAASPVYFRKQKILARRGK